MLKNFNINPVGFETDDIWEAAYKLSDNERIIAAKVDKLVEVVNKQEIITNGLMAVVGVGIAICCANLLVDDIKRRRGLNRRK